MSDIIDKVARASARATAALTDRDNAIRQALAEGRPLREIGEAAGLNHQTIANIRDRG